MRVAAGSTPLHWTPHRSQCAGAARGRGVSAMKPLNRRSVTVGLGAAVMGLPVVGPAGANPADDQLLPLVRRFQEALITPLGNLTKKQRWRVPHRRFRSTGTGRKPRVSLRRGFFLLTCLDAQGDQLRIRVIGATSATSDTPWGRKVRRKRRTKCCDGTLGKSFRPRPGRNSTDS